MIFERALASGDLLGAETTAAELGWINLLDALALLALLVEKEPRRGERGKARWLRRYLNAEPNAGLGEAATVVGALRALGGPGHVQALALLRALAEAAPRERPPQAMLDAIANRRRERGPQWH